MVPRIADHLAGFAIMAGHPNNVDLVNIRNLPFKFWLEEKILSIIEVCKLKNILKKSTNFTTNMAVSIRKVR